MLHAHIHQRTPLGRAGPRAPEVSGDKKPKGIQTPQAGPRALDPARLRILAGKRLTRLLQHAGELPAQGRQGVLLPPMDPAFLASELGCRPAQASDILHELTLAGVLVRDGDRWRVPEVHALEQWPPR